MLCVAFLAMALEHDAHHAGKSINIALNINERSTCIDTPALVFTPQTKNVRRYTFAYFSVITITCAHTYANKYVRTHMFTRLKLGECVTADHTQDV